MQDEQAQRRLMRSATVLITMQTHELHETTFAHFNLYVSFVYFFSMILFKHVILLFSLSLTFEKIFVLLYF